MDGGDPRREAAVLGPDRFLAAAVSELSGMPKARLNMVSQQAGIRERFPTRKMPWTQSLAYVCLMRYNAAHRETL